MRDTDILEGSREAPATAPTTSHLNVVVRSPSLHWGGSKWLVNSPRVSSSGDSPLDNSSHFLSLLSNARSHVDSTLKPISEVALFTRVVLRYVCITVTAGCRLMDDLYFACLFFFVLESGT